MHYGNALASISAMDLQMHCGNAQANALLQCICKCIIMFSKVKQYKLNLQKTMSLQLENQPKNTVWAIILVSKLLLKTVRSDHLSIILVFVFISPKFQNERSFYLCDHFSYPILFRRLRRRKKAGDHSTWVIILVDTYCIPLKNPPPITPKCRVLWGGGFL